MSVQLFMFEMVNQWAPYVKKSVGRFIFVEAYSLHLYDDRFVEQFLKAWRV